MVRIEKNRLPRRATGGVRISPSLPLTPQQHDAANPNRRNVVKNPNELTIENSALVLIDHQPWVAFGVKSIDTGLLVNNVAGLAKTARDLGVPTVLTTVGARGSVLADPIFKEIGDLFPNVKPIDRTSTHAWSHPQVR